MAEERIVLQAAVHPETYRWLEREADALGTSRGDVIDELVWRARREDEEEVPGAFADCGRVKVHVPGVPELLDLPIWKAREFAISLLLACAAARDQGGKE